MLAQRSTWRRMGAKAKRKMAREDLHIRITSVKAGELTVEMKGEVHFDFDDSDDYVHDVMSRKPKKVTVDATELTFISSVGMRFLMQLHKAAKEKGASFAVVGLQPQVRQVLEHARVLHLFVGDAGE